MELTYADLVAKHCNKPRKYAFRDLTEKRDGRRGSDMRSIVSYYTPEQIMLNKALTLFVEEMQ